MKEGNIMLHIDLPDEQHWLRTYCPICQQLMPLTRLRPYTGKHGEAVLASHCVCPQCQIWVRMTISRELAARYTHDPDLVGA